MIQWSSKVPKTVATSSTNAEVQAAVGLAKDTVWLRTLLDEIGFVQRGSTIMYQDNQPAIFQINDTKGTAMSKHYLVLLRKLQELVHLGIIHMNPIDTHENVADLFTKPLEPKKFWYFTQQAVGDYVSDTHAHLLRDFSRQNKQRKPRDGGSAQTYGRELAAPARSTLMKEMDRARQIGRGDYASESEHTTAVVCLSAVDEGFSRFSDKFYAGTE